jgi:hypothetical protein
LTHLPRVFAGAASRVYLPSSKASAAVRNVPFSYLGNRSAIENFDVDVALDGRDSISSLAPLRSASNMFSLFPFGSLFISC